MKKIISLFIFIFSFTFISSAQDLSIYQKKLFIHENDTLPYRILYPVDFIEGKKYPVIIFLHGSGEKGNDNEAQLSHGADVLLKDDFRKRFPCIVIFPQCPESTNWSYYKEIEDTIKESSEFYFSFQNKATMPEQLTKLLADSLIQTGEADKKRIYLGGLSLGGFGTYDMLMLFPKYFAAGFPMCGACDVNSFVQRSRKIPLWIFHGAKDDVVNPAIDRELFKVLTDAGIKKSKYTEYPEANHNCWDRAFAEPDLLPWLFSKHR